MTHFFRQWYVAPIFLVVFGIFIFVPFLFFGQVSPGNEQIGFYYALTHFTQAAVHDGTSLLWNGGNYGGESATFNQFASAWNPLNRLLMVFFSYVTVEHLSICISTIGGLVFAYWFGRKQGWQIASSLALAFMYLSAVTFGWLQVGTLPSGAFLVCPAVLLALLYAAQAKSLRALLLAVGFGGILFGFGFLAGFMQFLLYNACVAGLYALFLDWEKWKKGNTLFTNCSTAISYGVMIALGLLIGIKQWLPSTVLMALSVRTGTFAIQNAEVPHVTHFLTYILPPYFDIPYLGGGSGEGLYIGALGLIGAIVGLIYYRTRTSLLFAGAYALVGALACHAPGLSWLNEHIPPFSHMSGNLRWFAAGAFPVAYLGAAGIEGMLSRPEVLSAKTRRVVLWGSAGVAALLVLGSLLVRVIAHFAAASPAFLSQVLVWFTHGRTLTYGNDYYIHLLATAFGTIAALFSLDNPRFVFGVFCWLLALVVAYILLTPRLRHLGAPMVVACMVATVGGTIVLQWGNLVPRGLYEQTPQLVSYLQKREADPHTYRILGLLVGDGLYRQYFSSYQVTPKESAIIHRETIANDANLLYGVDSMSGLRPYQTLRMNQLLGTVVGYETENYIFDPQSAALQTSTLARLYNTDVEKKVSVEEKKKDLLQKLPLLSMMNVQYLYSPETFSDASLQLLDTIEIPVMGGIPLYIYENKTVLPRVYISSSQRFVSGSNKEVLLQVAAVPDFSKETVIECGDCSLAVGTAGTVRVSAYENGHIQFTTQSDRDVWIVVSESAAPGWKATIDGEEAQLHTANYIFQAIRVPKGDHQVILAYYDPHLF